MVEFVFGNAPLSGVIDKKTEKVCPFVLIVALLGSDWQ
jgi:hypothetical protein